jgi:predicted nucleotide-binding protein
VPEEFRDKHLSAVLKSTQSGPEKWTFDNDEEFFAEYRKPVDSARIYYGSSEGAILDCRFYEYYTVVDVKLAERYQVENVFEVFEDAYEQSLIPTSEEAAPVAPPKPKVFIGHGRSPLWRELADHLTYLQGFDIDAYETGPRAGQTTKEVLHDLLYKASFALLIHTAEDEQADGQLRARENVVHETGLFQGRLGFQRAIVLREESCQEFSNHSGITEIRFSRGNIRETFGEVVATLYREFPPQQL